MIIAPDVVGWVGNQQVIFFSGTLLHTTSHGHTDSTWILRVYSLPTFWQISPTSGSLLSQVSRPPVDSSFSEEIDTLPKTKQILLYSFINYNKLITTKVLIWIVSWACLVVCLYLTAVTDLLPQHSGSCKAQLQCKYDGINGLVGSQEMAHWQEEKLRKENPFVQIKGQCNFRFCIIMFYG